MTAPRRAHINIPRDKLEFFQATLITLTGITLFTLGSDGAYRIDTSIYL